jgi:hypothetical protein
MRIFLKVLLWLDFIFSTVASLYDSTVNTSAAGQILGAATGISATVALAGLAIVGVIEDLKAKPTAAHSGISDETRQ